MKDAECVALLQWALPRLGLRHQGYRRVRGQVCKRLARRINELGLRDLTEYRRYLQAHPEEWPRLEALCRVTISRFYRDRGVFELLGSELLPELARACVRRGERRLVAWSAGAGAGEEPYSLAMVWRFRVLPQFPDLQLSIIATDAHEHQIERARKACYPGGTLRELPESWKEAAFSLGDEGHSVKPEIRAHVELRVGDVRDPPPDGPFDLVLCRNVVFTYFDANGQRCWLTELMGQLRPRGFLVLGRHETLPVAPQFQELRPGSRMYRFVA